jgi:hypothetical protein
MSQHRRPRNCHVGGGSDLEAICTYFMSDFKKNMLRKLCQNLRADIQLGYREN